MTGRVAFFDLDRTLLDVNSGSLWLRWEWRSGRLGVATLVRASWWLTRYALGADDLDDALHAAARVYEGLPEATMRDEVRGWFDREVVPHVRPGARAAIAAHREAGDLCVLATSSSQFAAECARELFGLDEALSTRVEVIDGTLTGSLEVLGFGKHKLDLCRRWAEARGVDLSAATFYSDSYSDLALLQEVGQPVVVDPDWRLKREARARGWTIADWGRATP